MDTPEHKNAYPGSHEIYYFDRPFLGYHFYALSLSESWTRVEKNAFSLNDLYGHAPAQDPLLQGS